MAILWSKEQNGDHYEVRSAGASRRLYSNGVFHSQWNPHRPLDGSLWDLLTAPAFLCESPSPLRVLILGVGAGAVIRKLHAYFSELEILGVELNPVHLQVARKFFGISMAQAELVQADAQQFVNDYQGEGFDLIIDDLFGHSAGEAQRAIRADKSWLSKLGALSRNGGFLTMNFADKKEWVAARRVRPAKFVGSFSLRATQYENVIGVFSQKKLPTKNIQQSLSVIPKLNASSKEKHRFHLQSH